MAGVSKELLQWDLPLPVHTATPTRGYGVVTITKQVKKNTIFLMR
jgi:hypothetical protein